MDVSQFLVYILLIFMMMIWGFNVIALKVVVSTFPAITITALRVFFAFLAILPFLLVGKKIRKFTWREVVFIIGISTFGMLGHQYFLSVGLNYTSAANAGIILGSAPIVTSVGAAYFLKDRLTLFRVIGMAFAFIGVTIIVLIGTQGNIAISRGDLYICLTVLVQTLSFILVKKATETIDVITLTGITQLIGSGMLLVLSFFIEPNGLYELKNGTLITWLLFLFSGCIATGLGYLIYNYAIQQIGTSQSSVFLNLSPFFTVLGAYMFLDENILFSHWVGFVLIVSGVIISSGYIQQLRNKGKFSSLKN